MMAKKEIITDLWVYDLLKQADVKLDAQGSTIKEIDDALKTASKKGTGNVGFPEYCGVVKDFIIVIENKYDLTRHINDLNDVVLLDVKSVTDYAVNGALFYGQHLAKNTSYKKILCFGISGNGKRHRITPIFVDETEYYRVLPDVESFVSFNTNNIEEYYIKEILQENTDKDKELADILRDAAILHEDLRNYGNLQDQQKPLVVSGILLALNEKGEDIITELQGDSVKTDGQILYSTIKTALQRANVSPEVKRDKILHQFGVIQDTAILNLIDENLNETPLKHYTKFLYNNIFKSIKYTDTSEDYLGRFYGEFMSYSGGDGQSLGIVLTPKHITELFCDLVNLKSSDVILDPCCGTGGFLISAMHNMLRQTDDKQEKIQIRKNRLHGIELQPYMFTIATTNMILRGDGKSNLINENFLSESASKLQLKGATVGMLNPPYSQGSKKNPNLYEIAFVEHLLDSLAPDGRCAVIVPQSTFTNKSNDEKMIKQNILKNHTLEGVITLNKNTFYGVGVLPCIAIFTAHQEHPADKICKFIDFQDDGWEVRQHIGLLETESAKDKKQHLLDVWKENVVAETKFCVESTVEIDDEWLHSFYYFNDEPPIVKDFDETIADYLSYEFSMIAHGREYLFRDGNENL